MSNANPKQLAGELTVQYGIVIPNYQPGTPAGCLYALAGVLYWGSNPIAGGSGTVSNFVANNLNPLFSCSVADPSTTPILSFALQDVAANLVLAGPASGGPAAWAARALVAADIPDLSAVYQLALGYTAENVANKSTDQTMGGASPSDALYGSQKAVKAYVDSKGAVAGTMVYQGTIDASTNPNYPAATQGYVYEISVGGLIGGASGRNVSAGDAIVCLNTTAAGTQAQVGANWDLLKTDVSSTDQTLGGGSPSDLVLPTQKAVKAYCDALLAASEAMIYKGVIDCSGSPNYPAATAGWCYKVSVAGLIGGAAGVSVQVGDTILCCVTNSGGTQAQVGADFDVIQVGIPGAVMGPISSVNNRLAIFNGATGTLIADSGVLLSALVLQGLLTGAGLTMNTGKLLGRNTAAAGAVEELTPSAGIVLGSGSITLATVLMAIVNLSASAGYLGQDGAGNFSYDNVITSSRWTMHTSRLLGRYDAGTGAIEEVQIGTNLSLSAGGFLSATSSGGLTGLDIREVWTFGGP